MAVLTVTWNVPDAADVQDKLCTAWSYTGFNLGQAETKPAFLKRKLGEYWKNAYMAQAVKSAQDAAGITAAIAADTASTFT